MKKINCVTQEQKTLILSLSLLPEVMSQDYRSLLGEVERKKILNARQEVMEVLEVVLRSVTVELLQKLRKEIRGLKFAINRSGEPKKSERIVNSWDLETIIEHSMVNCYNCDKNHKACRLNEALKRLNIPVADETATGCKYKLERG